MRVLLTGGTGQLGWALKATQPDGLGHQPLEVLVTSRHGGDGRLALDLTDLEACRVAVLEYRPDWILNAGAYTAVDRAESEPELAWAVNSGAPRVLAQALAELGHGRFLQLSTDFVFDGCQGHPYQPHQLRRPLGVYGASKAAGEEAVLAVLGSNAAIVRTSWLYGPVGHNFCLTMLRLHEARAAAGEPLAVVADQVGCPTSTMGLAVACWRALPLTDLPPILHWSDAGVASWYDFAVAIGELGVALGLLTQAATVQPITTADYPTPACRPPYSVLDCGSSRDALALEPKHWRQSLQSVLQHIVELRQDLWGNDSSPLVSAGA